MTHKEEHVAELADIIEQDCEKHKDCPYEDMAYNCKACFDCVAQAIIESGYVRLPYIIRLLRHQRDS